MFQVENRSLRNHPKALWASLLGLKDEKVVSELDPKMIHLSKKPENDFLKMASAEKIFENLSDSIYKDDWCLWSNEERKIKAEHLMLFFCDILKLICYKMFSETLLRPKRIHESYPTALVLNDY